MRPSAPRVLWLADSQPGYRVALWRSLSALLPLRVAGLGSEAPPPGDLGELTYHALPARRIRLGTRFAMAGWAHGWGQLLRGTGVDVLVLDGWASPAHLRGALWARTHRIPLVIFHRSTANSHLFLSGPVAGLRRAVFRSAQAIYAGGVECRDDLQAMGVDADKIVVGINTVDVDHVREQVIRLREGLREGPPGHRFLYVGSLVPRKGVDLVVSAFEAVAGPHDSLTIVGDGPLMGQLRVQAATSARPITFLGHLDAEGVVSAYASSHTLVMPSRVEIWGLVANEALASGMHLVASTSAGVYSEVKHMQGVFGAEPSIAGVTEAMRSSRDAWTGHVSSPEMLEHTVDAMAGGLAAVITKAWVESRDEPRGPEKALAGTHVLVLWQGMSGYFNASLRALAQQPGVTISLAHESASVQAPFDDAQFSWVSDRYEWTGQPDQARVRSLIADRRPDLVLVSSWHIDGYRALLRDLRGEGIPRLLCMDNQWHGTPKQWLGRISWRTYIRPLYDGAFVPGDRTARFAQMLGFRDGHILRGLYCGDTPAFTCPSDQVRDRAFLYVGRLSPEKGLDVLLRAYSDYRSTCADPWPLRVVGTGPLLDQLDGVPGVQHLGFVQPADLPAVMWQARALVVASKFEPWGVVVHEAAAAGLVVLASDQVGAAVHLVQDGFNGYVTHAGDARELSKVMQQLSQQSEDRLDEMSRGSLALSRQLEPSRWATYLLDEGLQIQSQETRRKR